MEGRESRSACTYAVHPGAQFVHGAANTVDRRIPLGELAAVHRFCGSRSHLAVGNAADHIAAHIDIALLDGDVVVGAVTGLHGKAAVGD